MGAGEISLDAAPRIDLIANRWRWHMHRQTGSLLVPVATEGLWKYSLEYRSPWRGVVAKNGEAGRVLGRRRAELTVPWDEAATGAARVRVRFAEGGKGQRLTVRVNGAAGKVVAVERGAGEVEVAVEAGLREGLALLGLPVDRRMQGMSLLPLIERRGPWPPRAVASEYGRAYALRAGRWHYIVDYAGAAALYDLSDDPDETRDVAAAQPMATRYLRDAAGFYLAYRSSWQAATWGSLNDLLPTAPLPAAPR